MAGDLMEGGVSAFWKGCGGTLFREKGSPAILLLKLRCVLTCSRCQILRKAVKAEGSSVLLNRLILKGCQAAVQIGEGSILGKFGGVLPHKRKEKRIGAELFGEGGE